MPPAPMPPRRLSRLVDRLITAGQVLAALTMVYLMVTVTVGVVARAALNEPMAWVIELGGPALVGMTFLGAAAVARDDGHVRLEVLDEFLSARVITRLSGVATVIELVVIGALLYATTRQWLADFQSGTYASGFLRVERWRLTAVIPLGTLLYLLFLLRGLLGGRTATSAVATELRSTATAPAETAGTERARS